MGGYSLYSRGLADENIRALSAEGFPTSGPVARR
jgi:hypothetical protein